MVEEKETIGLLTAVKSNHQREWSHWIEDARGNTVAAVVMNEECEKYARAFSAVSHLIEACESAMFALGRHGANVIGGEGRSEWEACREALTKARGY